MHYVDFVMQKNKTYAIKHRPMQKKLCRKTCMQLDVCN